MLISLITDKYPNIVSFVLDDLNTNFIIKFVSESITLALTPKEKQKIPNFLSFDSTEKFPIDSSFGSSSEIPLIEGKTDIATNTFDSEIGFDFNAAQYQPTICQYQTQTVKFDAQTLNILTAALLKLSKNMADNSVLNSLKMILQLLMVNDTNSCFIFAYNWLKYFPLSESMIDTIRLVLYNFLRIAFINYPDDVSLCKMSMELLSFMMQTLKANIDIFFPPLEIFHEAAMRFDLTEKLFELVKICLFIDPQKFSFLFDALQFNILLSKIIVFQQKYALKFPEDERIRKNRRIVFSFIELISKDSKMFMLLIQTPEFLLSVSELIFEEKLKRFSLAFMDAALSKLTTNNKSFLSLFSFFESVLQSGPEEISKQIIDLFISDFQKNKKELQIVLTQSQFIQEVINFVGKYPNNLSKAFELFALCRNEVTSRYFSSLSSVLTEKDADNIENELFENNFKTNPIALSVIFDAFSFERKKALLEKVLICCKASEKTTLVVNTSDIPAKCIKCISEYRQKTEKDAFFEVLCQFLTHVSKQAMKSSDLLALIQTISSLPGNKRPFFTIDVLKILESTFSSNYSAPTSLFKSYGVPTALPSVPLTKVMTDFTWFCEIKFRNSNGNILRIESSNGALVSFDFVDKRISATLKDSQIIKGFFTFVFELHRWYRISIVFTGGMFILYVNGKPASTLQGRQLQFGGVLSQSGFGAKLEADYGTLLLCTNPLTKQENELLYYFPPVPCTFSPFEADDFDPFFKPLFSGKIYYSAVYLFNAALLNNGFAVNMAPIRDPKMMKISCLTFSFPMRPKDALTYIGGISTILPLFAQLDLTIYGREQEKGEVDTTFLPSLLDLLKSLLEKSTKNQEELLSCDGFKIISYLLAKSRLAHLTNESIDKFRDIFSVIYILPLADQMLNFIFMNPQLWLYLPLERQQYLYQTVLGMFQNSPKEKQIWFAKCIPFSKVLTIMRVCYWSKLTDPQVCLLQAPKIDPVTKEVEAERPIENIPKLRNTLWIMASQIADVRFTLSDVSTLCFYSFDQKDIELTVSTLSFLLKFLNTKQKEVLTALKTNFRFSSFFPLLISTDQKLRGQCIHLFMKCASLTSDNRQLFLNPYTFDEWINGIIVTISLQNTTALLPDLVYGYMYGLYDPSQVAVMPKERISKTEHSDSFSFCYPQLIPLCLLLVSEMEDDLCCKYLESIRETSSVQFALVFQSEKWYVPFLIFIISRMKNATKIEEFDKATKLCINILLILFCKYINYNKNPIFTHFSLYIYLIATLTKRDVSFFIKLLLETLLNDQELFSSVKENSMALSQVIEACFDYIFIQPETSKYFVPQIPQHENEQKNEEERVPQIEQSSFQELYKMLIATTFPKIRFCYGTRINSENLSWEDATFADNLLEKMRTFVLSSQEFVRFSFILGIGLQFPRYFSIFSRYIRDISNLISPKCSEDDVMAFTNYMSGLIKIYMQTDYGHQSHLYLQEDTQSFSQLIDTVFKQRMSWGTSLSSFDSCFQASGHNYAHSILEKFSNESEGKMIQRSKEKTRFMNTNLLKLAEYNKNFAGYFNRLNQEDASRKLDARSEQIRFQMTQYASDLRNAFARGQKLYTKLWRTIGVDNGAWASPEVCTVKHWKLSSIMTNHYKRNILVLNFKFTDHKSASLLRDIGNPVDAMEQYKKHLKEMRMSEFSEDNSILSLLPEDMKQSPSTSSIAEEAQTKEFIMKVETKLITMQKVYSGNLLLYYDLTIFEPTGLDTKTVVIHNKHIKRIFVRQYLLLDTAIEIFEENKSYLFDFSTSQRDNVLDFYENYCRSIKFIQRKPNDIYPLVEKLTEKWRKGKISNFDYLMTLNIYSGRTYNDLSKYPVFPWVIKDYTSKELDLDSADTFRDMAIPVGAVDQQRFELLRERMESAETDNDRYLYGSFYSSAAVVIGYMIRMEPFTSLHIELQSGKFDIADRLFNSIPKAWESVTSYAMDFRELTPEFFYLPDFLVNHNNFDLGRSNSDVELPPWAESAEDFIYKNAAALETPYVTAALPRWIDLIFGFASRGENAVEANNVYCPNFFDTIITPETMNDPQTLSFLREYVACFGQSSQQLFFEPHKSRSNPIRIFPSKSFSPSMRCDSTVLSISAHDSILTAIDTGFCCTVFADDKSIIAKTVLLHQTPPGSCDITKSSKCISIQRGTAVISEPWNVTYSKVNVATGEILAMKRIHTRSIECVSYDPPFIACSSSDCTVSLVRNNSTVMTLTKHRTAVACVSINKKSDSMISASIDGFVILSSISRLKEINSISIGAQPIFVSIADNGFIAIVSLSEGCFHLTVFDPNLEGQKTVDLDGSVDAMTAFNPPNGIAYAALSVRGEGTIIYNISSLQKVVSYDGEATAFAYDRKTDVLYRGNTMGEITSIKVKK